MRKIVLITMLLALTVIGSMNVYAADSNENVKETYIDNLYSELPEEVKDIIPEINEDGFITGESLVSMVEPFLSVWLSSLGLILSELLAVIIAALFCHILCDSFSIRFPLAQLVTCLLLALVLFDRVLKESDAVMSYCCKIQSFMLTTSGTMSTVLLTGGNGVTSVTTSSAVSYISVLFESSCLQLLMPAVKVSIMSTVSGVVCDDAMNMIGRFARGLFKSVISLITFLSVLLFTYQSIMSQAKDTLSARMLRYALSGSVPIVGGAVGESLSTLSTSVNMIRSSVGLFGVICVLLLALYPLANLLALKMAVLICEEITRNFNINFENKLLCEARKIVNMLIAIVVTIALLYIFCLSVYMMIPIAVR